MPPKKYAKADKNRAIAHPTLAGFPIETALRHLANDPDNSPTLRQTALVALTGRRDGQTSPEGHPEAFWALHDLLQDPDHNASGKPHPLASAYNWMSAADKVVLDSKTHQALTEASNDSKIGVPIANHGEWGYTPEHHAQRAASAINKLIADVEPWYHNQNVGIKNWVTNRVKQLHPIADQKAIEESIRRHAHRAALVWRVRHGIPDSNAARADEQDALQPVGSPAKDETTYRTNERASRYRRNSISLRQLPRKYAEELPGLVGGPVTMNPRVRSGPAGDPHETMDAAHTASARSNLNHLLPSTQDTTAGNALADAMQENGLPHAPFYANLVPNIRTHGLPFRYETTHGAYAPDGLSGFPRGNVLDDNSQWTLEGAKKQGDWAPSVALIHRRPLTTSVPSSVTHTAVLGAPELREWASHPQVAPHLKAALERAATHLEANAGPRKSRRKPNKYAQQRNDFIDALRRARSKQMTALKAAAKQVAARLGFVHSSAVSSLHDGPYGATPGLSQAMYGNVPPEQIHAAASWQALMSNSPGIGVFHIRPNGPDALYRARFSGSGLALRQKLDRAGIAQRVLIPHRSGFDVMIPDPGSRLGATVQQFAKQNGTQLQVSRGFLKSIGDADKANARSRFRDTISGAERQQMKRRALKCL